MKRTRWVSAILAVAMTAALMAGCGSESGDTSSVSSTATASSGETSTEGTPLKVAVIQYGTSFVNQYIIDQGWDDEAGIPFEVVTFDGGASINEAMAAGEWDVAITGGAAVFGIANYGAKLIGYHMDGTGENSIVAREGDPIFDVQGYNEDCPEVYGDPETVKGSTIITRTGSTTQYMVNTWLTTIGVDPNECELLNMSVDQGVTSFKAGEADYAGITDGTALTQMDENGWKEVASLNTLGVKMYESLLCTPDAYENRYDDVVKFIELVYRANNALAADPDLYTEYQKIWDEKNGRNSTDEAMEYDREQRPVLTSDQAKELDLYEFMDNITQFYIDCDMLDASAAETVDNNIETGAWEEALASFD